MMCPWSLEECYLGSAIKKNSLILFDENHNGKYNVHVS